MNLNVLRGIPEKYLKMDKEEIFTRVEQAKKKLGKDLLILGHHYQTDEIIKFADVKGDSLALSQEATKIKNVKYVIFCGVHFMAEVADMLTDDSVKVILPDVDAGCTMADTANIKDVESAWYGMKKVMEPKTVITPITYINCDAQLKAFVGKHNGAICTSSNAEKIIKWALERGDKLFFFPDQHLGRNVSYKSGIPHEKMKLWKAKTEWGGNTKKDIENAKVILWDGSCSVHTKFKLSHIEKQRKLDPEINIIVHPECEFEVVNNADYSGSTAYIINIIKNAPSGSRWAVGTESNLVKRLSKMYPDKHIVNLSDFPCLCGTMYRVRLPYLLNVLENLTEDRVINQIKVDENTSKYTKIALDNMFKITNL